MVIWLALTVSYRYLKFEIKSPMYRGFETPLRSSDAENIGNLECREPHQGKVIWRLIRDFGEISSIFSGFSKSRKIFTIRLIRK